jgi:BirA family biotin operon repressor/biotin-[acetyl-CoA-carboxylase] ligase
VDSKPSDSPALNMVLLDRLRAAAGQFVSLAELGSDRRQVWDDLDALSAFGFELERHPYLGAAYRAPSPRLCPDQIEHRLGTRRIGRRIAVWNRVGSTNDLAARAASAIANDGLVVFAEEQTTGRGQRGRVWTAPARSSILMSVLLFPPPELLPISPRASVGSAWLTALAAVATAEMVEDWTGCRAQIKWPNDVRVADRKIAGILVERALSLPVSAGAAGVEGHGRSAVVIGIGLNVNVDALSFPLELRSHATSLSMLRSGAPVDRSELARGLLRRLDAWYEEGLVNGPASLNAPWRDRSEHLGKEVCVVTRGEQVRGRLVDLDLHCGLTLELGGEARPCIGALDDRSGLDHESRLSRLPLGNVLAIET